MIPTFKKQPLLNTSLVHNTYQIYFTLCLDLISSLMYREHFLKLIYILRFPGGSDGKNLPAMRETQVQSLGWEDPQQKAMAAFQYFCLENAGDRGARWATVHGAAGVAKSQT